MAKVDPRELTPTHDCNTCLMWRGMGNKFKGVRVKGGFGKCIRAQGPCENPKPRLGIGGVRQGYDREITELVDGKAGEPHRAGPPCDGTACETCDNATIKAHCRKGE